MKIERTMRNEISAAELFEMVCTKEFQERSRAPLKMPSAPSEEKFAGCGTSRNKPTSTPAKTVRVVAMTSLRGESFPDVLMHSSSHSKPDAILVASARDRQAHGWLSMGSAGLRHGMPSVGLR